MDWAKNRFSKRHGLDPKRPTKQILDDAPEWLRQAFFSSILSKYTYIDGDSRYPNSDERPLGIKKLCEDFCLLQRELPNEAMYDSWSCEGALKEQVLTCAWYYFYDLVEKVAHELISCDASVYHAEDIVPLSADEFEKLTKRLKYSYDEYRQQVNDLFEDQSIGWRLDAVGDLQRNLPKLLQEKLVATEKKLDGFESAREHYKKAIKYTQSRSGDPENAIKEIVSAIESMGKRFYPKTKTLGDVLKHAKAANDFPELLIGMLQKFYDFTNATPAIRHGHDTSSKIKLEDAEFCLHVGTSFIRYILAKKS